MERIGIVISVVLLGIFALSQVELAPASFASPAGASETTFNAAPFVSVQSVMTGSRRMLA
jgi:hypothetical protein